MDRRPLALVETALLSSTGGLVWIVGLYLGLSPLLRLFFPLPIALSYLRWGRRAAWMTNLVTTLLLSVLIGPARSIQFLIPYGLLGIVLGFAWHRRRSWLSAILWGAVLSTAGLVFQIWLLSVLAGDDLWRYLTVQIHTWLAWGFDRLGLLATPSIFLVQLLVVGTLFLQSVIYLFAIHVVAWVLLERLGNPISPPPDWVKSLVDEEGL